MKTLLACLILSFVSTVYADTPTRINDGVAKFAYGQVGSTYAWNVTEYNQMVADCVGECPTQLYTPTTFEVRLSTSFMFKSYTDYLEVKVMAGDELDFAKDELDREEKIKHFKKEKK